MDQLVLDTREEQSPEVVEQDKVPACGGRAKPDGEGDPAGEVGWFLQREREKRGLSLEEVGEYIAVHPYHIEAIEYGDMTCMPQRIEALQMISAYADFLGFHPDPLLQHYIAILPPPELAPKNHPASPAPLSSARILAFSKKLPKLPHINMKLPSVKLDNNGVVASVAAAFMLFAGTTWIISPGQEPKALTNIVAEMPSATERMPEVTTGGDAAQVKITDLEITDQPLSKTDDMAVASTAEYRCNRSIWVIRLVHLSRSRSDRKRDRFLRQRLSRLRR
jgi:cytoskeleton protein RodZ